jgi:anti-sigma factor RsiW
MNINRHNYEEFFLLYADNELSAAGRREVEAFMEQHPDLAGELELFLQLKLDPETPPNFPGKDSLMRREEVEVPEADAFLLSYLDNELDASEKADAERRLSTDPSLAARLEQFRLAVLPSEKIAFPDKASLYRKDEKPARIIYLRWMRAAVAAAVILAGGLLWSNFSQRSAGGSQQTLASSQVPVASSQRPVAGGQLADANGQAPIREANAAQDNAARTTNNEQQMAANTVTKSSSVRNNDRDAEQTPVVMANPDNHLPITENTQQAATNNLPDLTHAVAANTVPEVGKPEIVDAPSIPSDTKSNYAAEALMSDKTGTPDLMDEGEKSRKGPFRGLVRKASRFLNKAANPDPDKATVRVASFEIALGR